MAKMEDCQDLEIYPFSLHTFKYVSLFIKGDKNLLQNNSKDFKITRQMTRCKQKIWILKIIRQKTRVNKYQLDANTFPGISQNYGKR